MQRLHKALRVRVRDDLDGILKLVRTAVAFIGIVCAYGIAPAHAQTPAPVQTAGPASTPIFVLVPYGEPNNKDPHSDGMTSALQADLTAAHITYTTIPPIDHLQAISQAAQLCAQNKATGLLIAEGRYEQTVHTTMIPLLPMQLSSYPSHVEVRLDQFNCNGAVV